MTDVEEQLEQGTDLLEREPALAALLPLLEQVRAGRGGLAVVEGPPGIGKSVLLRDVIARARSLGLRVARAQAAELERDLPWAVVRQLYDAAASDSDLEPGAISRVLGDGRGELAPPLVGPALTVLHQGVVDFAAQRPLLFVLDDAQWADADSIRALHYLCRRIDRAPVGVLIGRRPMGGSPELDTLVALSAEPPVALTPLGVEGVRRLLERLLGPPLDDVFVRTCHGVTGGNPLLLHELVRELVAGGHPREGSAVLVLGPTSVARTALARMGRLAPNAARVARAVCVLGHQRATTARVARLAGVPTEEVGAVVAALVDAELLADSTPLGWIHPLIGAALYRHTPVAERARLHGAAARALADDGVSVDEVAAHLLHAEPAGDPWVVQQLQLAARRSVRVGAVEYAGRLLSRALDEPPGAERGDVLLELGQVQAWGLGRGAARHLAAAFRSHPDPAGRGRAALVLARLMGSSARWTSALELLDAALEQVDAAAHPRLHLELRNERLVAMDSSGIGIDQLGPEAERLLAAPSDTPEHRVGCIHAVTVRAAALAPVEELRALARAAWADGALLTELGVDSPAWLFAAWQLAALGLHDEAEAVYRAALGAAERTGSRLGSLQARVGLAWLALDRGQLDEAVEGFGEAQATATQVLGVGSRFAAAGLASALLGRGDLEGAAAAVAPYESPVCDPPDAYDAFLLRARGRVLLAAGDAAGAVEAFDRLGQWCLARGLDSPVDWPWRTDLAHALSALGRSDQAIALAQESLERAATVGLPRAVGAARRAVALLGPQGARRGALEQAAEELGVAGVVYERSVTLVELAAVRRGAGDVSAARTSALEALALADSCGAGEVRERALAEARLTGARPRRTAVSGPQALTGSERRVGELVARGLTNRQVAAHLVVSEKTVEKHLSAVFRKLGVSQRDQIGQMMTKQ